MRLVGWSMNFWISEFLNWPTICFHTGWHPLRRKLGRKIGTHEQIMLARGFQGDVVYLYLPIAPLVYKHKCGGRGGLRGLSQWEQLWHGAQINFGDLSPYLIYESVLWKELLTDPYRGPRSNRHLTPTMYVLMFLMKYFLISTWADIWSSHVRNYI